MRIARGRRHPRTARCWINTRIRRCTQLRIGASGLPRTSFPLLPRKPAAPLWLPSTPFFLPFLRSAPFRCRNSCSTRSTASVVRAPVELDHRKPLHRSVLVTNIVTVQFFFIPILFILRRRVPPHTFLAPIARLSNRGALLLAREITTIRARLQAGRLLVHDLPFVRS
jgi:hypothetical protein